MLFEAYPNFHPTEGTFMAYELVSNEVPVDELKVVVVQVLSQPGSFPPSAGDLLDLWRRARGQLPPQDGAERALEAIRAAIWAVGYVGTPTFDDALVERTVKAYGWLNICTSEEPEIVFAQLKKMYEGFARGAAESARLTTEYRKLVEGTAKKLEDKSGGTSEVQQARVRADDVADVPVVRRLASD